MPVTATVELQCFWCDPFIQKHFRSGVSLHSHTMYSEESLEIVPLWLAEKPNIGRLLRHGFWTPPLAPRQAYRLEQKQIEKQFQLPGLVSLTDHDDIRAGTLLRVLDRFHDAPVSTEWTIPFGPTSFHMGVHNLRPSRATAVMQELASFTAARRGSQLSQILETLSSDPQILLVLNHPLWDEKRIGNRRHVHELDELVRQHGRYIHALEINGLRPWAENKRVLRLGREVNLPVVAGGDRHGLEPNAILNLSCASTLSEFILEVRERRFSHVVLMPQYRQWRRLRIFHAIVDVLRDYPENPEGHRTWGDRIFYRDPEATGPVPFASVWGHDGVKFVNHILAAMRLVDRRPPSAILTSA